MKVFIATEGGKGIGFGHITRCSALYEAFKKKGLKPCFIANADNSVKALLKGKKAEIFNWLKRQAGLLDLISGADVVIIDSYLAESSLYKKISGRVKISVYMDDNNRIKYPRGIVVNGSIYAKKLNYPKMNGIKYLLGIKYLPLRKEFWRISNKNIRKEIKTVMITFGGDDSKNMTPRILNLLAAEFPSLKKKVIIGQSFNNVQQIREAADDRTELVYYPDTRKMRDVMRTSDIAVSAAGQTLYELARFGVPTVAVAVAKNQLNNIIEWQNTGFVNSAGWWEDKNILSRISTDIKNLEDENVRIKKSVIGRRLVDGNGAIRISDYIINRLEKCKTSNSFLINGKPLLGQNRISLKPADRNNCKDIWLWRNYAGTRKASFDERRIPWREHERWFKSKVADKNARIYIAEKGTDKIGVIRFESEGRNVYVSINLNPVFFGKGFGTRVIKLGSKKFMSETKKARQIISEIKKDNLISQKAFAKAGYKYIGNNGERVIYIMENSHE